VAILLIFSNLYLFSLFANAWNVPKPQLPESAHYSCVIVLGGFAGSDDGKKGFFNDVSNRFIQGAQLVLSKKASHILITGGNGSLIPNGFSEGEWSRGQLKLLNVADSAILIEGKSRNTLENARFSKQLLQQSKLKPPYLLVTSNFHMRRSLMICKKSGLNVIPYPVDYFGSGGLFDNIIPDYGVLLQWNKYIKELVGYMVNYFML